MASDASKRMTGRQGGRGGFTLIELLVAMVVTAILAAMVLTTFTAQNQMYRRQHDIGRTQQNLRLAMEIVSKDIAIAGFGGGGSGEFYGTLGTGGNSNALEGIIDGDDENSDGRDAIFLAYMDPDRNNWGFVDRSEAATANAASYLCDTDTLHFTSNSATAAGNFQASNRQWSYINCFSNAGNEGLGMGLLWSVSGNGDANSGTVNVQSNTGYADYTNVCNHNVNQSLPEELVCGRLIQVSYYIDRDGDGHGQGSSSLPYLYLDYDGVIDDGSNEVPIAPAIEDMQLGYCQTMQDCDALEWVGRNTVPTPYNFANLSRVRLRMTARSERTAENSLPASKPPTLDPSFSRASENTDAYHRRVAHQVVVLRNARAAHEIRDAY
jgi:prepilin-type N-terminal cleavage/methylation domain-containing protein